MYHVDVSCKEDSVFNVTSGGAKVTIDMAEKESHLGDGIVAMSDMDCVKWRSYLAYTCERNVAKIVSGDKRKAIVQEVHQEIAFWLTNYGARLRIPLWEILYNMR